MSERSALGIDVGGTNIKAALVREDGEVLNRLRLPSSGDLGASLSEAIATLRTEGCLGVGVAVAGLVDREARRVLFSPNLQTASSVDFGSLTGGLPLEMENDACAAALGELWLGAGRQYRDFVLFTLGTGIGAAVVHKGKLLRIASEAGHMCIESEGLRCGCGSNGCLEVYASASAVVASATKALEQGTGSLLRDCCEGNIYRLTSEMIFKTAFEGDPLSREVLKRAGRAFGIGMANMVNLFGPEAIVLTGGLTGAWSIYVEEAVKEASRRALKGLFEPVKVVKAALGAEDAGVMGAAALVLNG